MPPAGAVSAPRLAWDVSGQGESLLTALFPHLAGLRVHRVEDIGHAVVISASCRAAAACCPRCGQESARVHGGYSRVIADGAAGGRPVLIVLRVRRFPCRNPQCPAVTFAEQAGGLSERYRRRSVPLLAMLAGFGLELAGRAAVRLAGTLGIAVHPSTVLRLVMALPDPPVSASPQVTGVDDFALRKGHVYGTVVADAESGDVIDLLPDREAATLREWLKARPGAEVICRDRASAYAVRGSPRRRAGRDPGRRSLAPVAQPGRMRREDGDTAPRLPEGAARRRRRRRSGRAGRAGRVPGRVRQGTADGQAHQGTLRRDPRAARRRAAGGRDPPRHRSLDRRTVQRYAWAASADELLASMSRESKLDEFKPYICQRWNQGLTDAAQLHAELAQRGWADSPQTVRRYVHLLRQAGPAVTPAPAAPKTREITRWLLSRPGSLGDGDQARLAAVRAGCAHLDALAGHIRDFAGMMTRRQGLLALDDWLTRAEADDQPELHSFAAGIRRDQEAVTAGLALPYSSAAMEGNVNKIKMIKRQMYGRAWLRPPPQTCNPSPCVTPITKFAQEPDRCRKVLMPSVA